MPKLIPLLILFVSVPLFSVDENAKLFKYAGFEEIDSHKLELSGFGTGFAITKEGHIITAAHVTKGCDEVKVIFNNSEPISAEVLIEEHELDLAVLKVPRSLSSYLKIKAHSSNLGDDVFTVGYPVPLLLGEGQKFTKGSVSSLTGLLGNSLRYQISVPIQPGNSGGPLVCEESGEVTGVIVSTLNEKHEQIDFNPQAINYAIKSGFILPILESIAIKFNADFEVEKTKNLKRQRVVNSTCMIVTCMRKPIKNNDTTVNSTSDKNNLLKMKLKDGTVVIKVFPELAPNHVARIKHLTKAGKYDGVVFHRVIDGFMAQSGDVQFGNVKGFNPLRVGTGGSNLDDLKAEFSDKKHVRGTCSMARSSNPNSANSQFFICLEPAPFLDGQYTVWGEVIKGMNYIDNIKKGSSTQNGIVANPDHILRMSME